MVSAGTRLAERDASDARTHPEPSISASPSPWLPSSALQRARAAQHMPLMMAREERWVRQCAASGERTQGGADAPRLQSAAAVAALLALRRLPR